MRPNILKNQNVTLDLKWRRFAFGVMWDVDVLQMFIGPVMVWVWLGKCRKGD